MKRRCNRTMVLCGKGNSTRAVPVHKLVEVISYRVIHVLPAVHSLTGTSKFSTKHSSLTHAKLEPDCLKHSANNNWWLKLSYMMQRFFLRTARHQNSRPSMHFSVVSIIKWRGWISTNLLLHSQVWKMVNVCRR